MRYVFLINSFSIKNDVDKLIDSISKACEELELDYKIEVNSPNKSTEKILDSYKLDNSVIIAVGGDGTINRVLNKLVGTKNVLGYIPYGTGNDFYRTNKELLEQGINNIDLIRINHRYFINVACFGIDADIANNEDIIHSKLIPKSQRYNASIVKNFLNYKPRHLTIYADGERYEGDYTTVALCNARYYGGGYKIGTNALLDDGLIDVYMADKMPKLEMAKLILGMKKGKHENHPLLKVVKAKKLFINSKESITCNIDGDKLSDRCFDVEVIPNGISVYYNQELIDKILNDKRR